MPPMPCPMCGHAPHTKSQCKGLLDDGSECKCRRECFHNSTPAVESALLAFIRAVQAKGYEAGLHTLSTIITKPDSQSWETTELRLTFGNGYFNWANVLVYVGEEMLGEALTEDAVKAYLEGKVPPIIPKP